MEFGPAKYGGEGEEQQHGVQEYESADGGIRVLEEHHERYQPDCILPESQLFCCEVGERHEKRPESSVEDTHEGIVHVFGVFFA